MRIPQYVESLVRILSLRNVETEEHTQRVASLACELAQYMNVPGKELPNIYRGALLHDIGKIGIPDLILLKKDSLRSDEQALMHMHPIYAYEVLFPISSMHPILDIPYCHHEKWNGTGYPRCLKGEQIPFPARIFAVVDVWDALLSDRPYRPRWTVKQASEYLLEQSGKHFDPKAVKSFFGLLDVQTKKNTSFRN